MIVFGLAGLAAGFIWLLGSSNPFTPAGYVGYLTRGAVFGKSRFYGVQRGPTSAGRSWLIDVTNVSVTPYTYSEDFTGNEAVLSRDNLKISFRVHTVWRVDERQVPLFMERFSTTVSNHHQTDRAPDSIVEVAYGNFVKEPLRTYARDEVQRRNGLEVRTRGFNRRSRPSAHSCLCRQSRYHHQRRRGQRAVSGEVADAVSKKLARRRIQRKDTEIEIERKERTKREVQAQGIANAMRSSAGS